MERTGEKDFGVIVSPPGSGKTIIGLELIAQKMEEKLRGKEEVVFLPEEVRSYSD